MTGPIVELRNPSWFRYLLEERGYTPASFALSIGVTPATIHRILAGTRNASPALAARIALALDQGMTVLFQVAA
jgi:plasmid maintenance system antidote protein VapI